MNKWLTPAVKALAAALLLVAAQVAAPATVGALCGVLPAVVQPVAAHPVAGRSALRSSTLVLLSHALKSE